MHPTNPFLSALELPFLLIAVFFAFRTAAAMQGGVFGKGMMWVAIGSTVMAIGHINLAVNSIWGINLINLLFGDQIGPIVFVIALVLTWAFSGYGFYLFYKTSRAS